MAPFLKFWVKPEFAPSVAKADASETGGPAAPASAPIPFHFVRIGPETTRTGAPASADPPAKPWVPPALASLEGYPSDPAGPPIDWYCARMAPLTTYAAADWSDCASMYTTGFAASLACTICT